MQHFEQFWWLDIVPCTCYTCIRPLVVGWRTTTRTTSRRCSSWSSATRLRWRRRCWLDWSVTERSVRFTVWRARWGTWTRQEGSSLCRVRDSFLTFKMTILSLLSLCHNFSVPMVFRHFCDQSVQFYILYDAVCQQSTFISVVFCLRPQGCKTVLGAQCPEIPSQTSLSHNAHTHRGHKTIWAQNCYQTWKWNIQILSVLKRLLNAILT